MLKRVASYSRVSTLNMGQTTDNQTSQIKEYCNRRGWIITEEIVDEGYSGKNDNRPGLKRLLDLALKRKIDVIVVTKLDRFFRSLQHIVTTLNNFSELKIEFISINDSIDLSTSSGRLMMHIIASFAEFERELISERTKNGMMAAQRKGAKIGRPSKVNQAEVLRLRDLGWSYKKIQLELGCSKGVICRSIKHAPKGFPKLNVIEPIEPKG